MTDKTVVLIGTGVLLFTMVLCGTCVQVNSIDAKAPVVETCIKHPVTRSPLTGRQ